MFLSVSDQQQPSRIHTSRSRDDCQPVFSLVYTHTQQARRKYVYIKIYKYHSCRMQTNWLGGGHIVCLLGIMDVTWPFDGV